VAVSIKEDVFGLDVSVNYTFLVEVLDSENLEGALVTLKRRGFFLKKEKRRYALIEGSKILRVRGQDNLCVLSRPPCRLDGKTAKMT